MTSERRKAILFLSITLVIGILIGSMLPGFFWRMRHKNMRAEGKEHERTEHPRDRQEMRKEGFERKIYEITKADSVQRKAIKPILDETSARIDGLQQRSYSRMTEVMDSMKLKLKPLLSDQQMKDLEDFSQKARARRKGSR
jgi:hypothetical protein